MAGKRARRENARGGGPPAGSEIPDAELRGALLGSVQEGISDAFYAKDDRGLYVTLNSAAARLLGKPIAEVLGKDDTRLFPAEDARRAMEADRRVMAGGVPETFEESLVADGVARTFQTTKGPIRDSQGRVVGLFGISRDITERKRAQEALRESEELFRYIFDNSVIGISITRPEGRIQVNPALAAMLGYSTAELERANWRDVTHPDDVEMTQRRIEELLAGGQRSTRFEKRFLHKDGSVVWADLSSALRRDPEGRPLYMVTGISDVSERKRTEQALEERTRELLALNEELARLSKEDALTGLANRRHFNDRLDHEWRRARRTGTSLALISIDVDHFKEFNDAYGHLEGDACLRKIGGYLSLAFGRANDLPARLGGDEFCILLADTPLDGAVLAAEKLRSAFEALAIPRAPFGNPGVMTLSLGATAGVPGPEPTAEALLHVADQALYAAKEQGRNRVSGLPLR